MGIDQPIAVYLEAIGHSCRIAQRGNHKGDDTGDTLHIVADRRDQLLQSIRMVLESCRSASTSEHAKDRQTDYSTDEETDYSTDEETDHSTERGFVSQLVVVCSFGGDPTLGIAAD